MSDKACGPHFLCCLLLPGRQKEGDSPSIHISNYGSVFQLKPGTSEKIIILINTYEFSLTVCLLISLCTFPMSFIELSALFRCDDINMQGVLWEIYTLHARKTLVKKSRVSFVACDRRANDVQR